MWLVAGLGAMGLLLGALLGLTSEALVGSTIALLFAFVGGSIFALLGKLTENDRRLAGQMLAALSICAIFGLSFGIAANTYRWFSPFPDAAQKTYVHKDDPYIRSKTVSLANEIDAEKQHGSITTDQAYEQMYRLALSQTDSGGK